MPPPAGGRSGPPGAQEETAVKHILSIYKPYLIRPTLYRTFNKFVVGLTLVLLWDRFLNHGRLEVVRDGFFVAGAVLLFMAWLSYLALDGLTVSHLFRAGKEKHKEKRKTVFHSTDMIDFADEHIPRLDELEEDERRFVYFFSSLIAGLCLLIPALVKFFM